MFITALASISPQHTFGADELPSEIVTYHTNRLACIEPDYKAWVDPKMIRRMSRIIKMGVATASLCLKNAGLEVPDAIVTGSAYGCLEDTGIFLNRMIEFNEEMLNPTAFIQSTHNTVAAQIALSVKCYGYNNTFVHRGFSFESALMDGIMLLKDNEANNVLIGAADEITDISFAILNRFGIYREQEVSNLQLIGEPGRGTIAGEGAAFFLLTKEGSANDCATLDAIHCFYRPDGVEKIISEIDSFLRAQSLTSADIDLVINGQNGDLANDSIYKQLNTKVFAQTPVTQYKHLCGEYPTSSAFALWYATTLIKNGYTGFGAGIDTLSSKPGKILIYNHYKNIHHSLFLVSAC
ncbi:MAG TPA: beta-ketoacyl synthase chain length factor [Flavitalea sp.]|nr:beta-ketoacyl synthase chain length factor [Flavitalea sp.]